MMVWIGFRYLKSRKILGFWFHFFHVDFGVGLGVTAMIVVLSVMDGFENELKNASWVLIYTFCFSHSADRWI